MIKAVFFDLGGVLVDITGLASSMARVFKKHVPEIKEDRTKLAMRWGHDTNTLFLSLRDQNFMSIQSMHHICLKKLLRRCGVSKSERFIARMVHDVWADFVDTSRLFPDVIPALDALSNKYILGIITDSDQDVAHGLLRKHLLTKYLTVQIVSDEVKRYKPDTLLFIQGLHQADCSRTEGAYVGDSLIDIKGASDIGMFTVIIDRKCNSLETPEMDVSPSGRIQSLFELDSLLCSLL